MWWIAHVMGDAMVGVDKRRERNRVALQVRATLHVPAHAPAVIVPTRIVDLSERGMRVLVRHPVEPGTQLYVDLECELPQHFHMGFDIDSLVVEGPLRPFELRLRATARWARRTGPHLWEVGLHLPTTARTREELELLRSYVEYLRGDREPWA